MPLYCVRVLDPNPLFGQNNGNVPFFTMKFFYEHSYGLPSQDHSR